MWRAPPGAKACLRGPGMGSIMHQALFAAAREPGTTQCAFPGAYGTPDMLGFGMSCVRGCPGGPREGKAARPSRQAGGAQQPIPSV